MESTRGPKEGKKVRRVSQREADRTKWQEKWFAAKLFLCADSRKASSALCLLPHPIAPVPSVCCTSASMGLLTGHCPFQWGSFVAACRQ